MKSVRHSEFDRQGGPRRFQQALLGVNEELRRKKKARRSPEASTT
jgi:hypothetical protein